MKALSGLFMFVGLIGLIIAILWRLMVKPFPVGNLSPDSILEFVNTCLLFAIALSVYGYSK